MPKSKVTWIVVADGMRARVFRQDKRGAPLIPALDQDLINPAAHGFAHDLRSDGSGRAFDTGSGARHRIEPRTDPKTHEKEVFARTVARLVDEAAQRNTFQRLILVAPPKTLGALRTNLAGRTKGLVAKELDRDLTLATAPQLASHLADFL